MIIIKRFLNFGEFAVIALLFMTMQKIVQSGDLHLYLNPDYHVFAHLSLIALFAFMIFSLILAAGRKGDREKLPDPGRLLIFLALIAVINTPPDSAAFSGHIAGNSFIAPGSSSYSSKSDEKAASDEERIFPEMDNLQPEAEKPAIENSKGIVFTKDNFYSLITDVYDNPDKYAGRSVEINGFVNKSRKLKNREFIIARLIIFCCAADAGLGGFICDASGIDENFSENEWLRIKGTLVKDFRSGDEIIPVIKIDSFNRIKPEEDPYIYPSYN